MPRHHMDDDEVRTRLLREPMAVEIMEKGKPAAKERNSGAEIDF